MQPVFTNRLANESSPYLKQHAHNPVDWYPWGPEALQKSRALDRPIFLSIGYSACHWCHVMEHESFEDPEVGRLLNEHFISIKVDREERPDLDHIYMTAVQLLTRQGGWPMSVFLTPDLQPFFGGTYFPPEDHYGRPGFKRLVTSLAEVWRTKRGDVNESAAQITEHVRAATAVGPGAGELRVETLRRAATWLGRAFDRTHGGFGSAPKFPHAMGDRMLLRAWHRFGDEDALHMVRLTLDRMAMGGMYDHLGGGFHRYSTDSHWLVPHFEKMLYDNALLSVSYLEAYQATGEPFYREVVEETLGYVRREMTSPEGAFWSTQDADSEGVEGKFFVWTIEELQQVLGKDAADVFGYVYDVTKNGNWEGHNILHRTKTIAQNAALLKISAEELNGILRGARAKLLEVRGNRIWPARDEKVLTAWNGLMISGFAQAAQALGVAEYADTAARSADFILGRMRTGDGRLLRTWGAGSQAKLNAYLEDYAFFIDGLVSLYEATFAPRWLTAARDLTDIMIAQFWDEAAGGFFFTGRDHEALIARAKDFTDSSIPSGNAMAATALLRLARLTGDARLQARAETVLRTAQAMMDSSPMAAGQMLIALDFFLGPVQEFAIIGDVQQAETRRVVRAIQSDFRPNKVVGLRGTDDAGAAEAVPLLKDKPGSSQVMTYICENFACQAPLVGAEAVEKALTQGQGERQE